jgi:guanylate kinase
MKAARDEISHWAEFDHVIVNSDLDQAIREAQAILTAARLVTRRQTTLTALVRSFNATESRDDI